MTEAHAMELILEQFTNNWATLTAGFTLPDGQTYSSGPPFALENEALPSDDAFAQVTIRHGTSQLITSGNTGTRRWRRNGRIYIKIWVPSNCGRAPLSSLCDIARTIFEGITLGGPPDEPVTILEGTTREVGVDGRWLMAVVEATFRYQQMH